MNLRYLYKINRFLFQIICLKNYPPLISIYFHHIDDNVINQIIKIKCFFDKLGYVFLTPNQIINNDYDKGLYISFDDNYKSWIEYSDKLVKNNIKATFFINTITFDNVKEINNYYDRLKFYGDRTPLNKNDLIELKNKGFVIGSHSHSHFNLAKIPYSIAKHEILINKKILEDIIEDNVKHFSFPYGMPKHFSNRLFNYCLSIGFKTVNYATPCMLYEKSIYNGKVNRHPWKEIIDFNENLINIRIDGNFFIKIFNKSPIG